MSGFIPSPTIILVTLSNGDAALFVNGDAVAQYDASYGGDNPATMADGLAAALKVELQSVTMDVPLDDDWNWNDVLELIPATEGQTGSVQVSLDGGVTYGSADDGVRVIYEGLPRPDSDEENGQLHVNLTDEGVIFDVWTPDAEESLGTRAQMAADIVADLADDAITDPWMDNAIQFPRLLCEINATQGLDTEALKDSMDLNSDRLEELFERAHKTWEAVKSRAPGPRG